MTKHPTPETKNHSTHPVRPADGDTPEQWQQAVAARAYQLYLDGGQQAGHDEENWLKAEQQLQIEQPVAARESDREPVVRAPESDYFTLQ